MRKIMKSAGIAAAYTSLNFRYSSLILPAGVVAYLMGVPTFMVVTAAVLLILATAAELTTSVINGITAAQALTMQDQYMSGGFDELAAYANGGWLNGSVEGQEPGPEGEDPGEGEGEAGRPVS